MAAPRILVIDDDKLIRWSVSEVLGRAGYQVEEAVSGETGLTTLRHSPPDLVLLDITLPDLDGFTVLQEIHRISPGLPVLMMTADATSETVREAQRLGACGHLDKPCNAATLQAAVSRALPASRPPAPPGGG